MKLNEMTGFSNELFNTKIKQKYGFGFNTKNLTTPKAKLLLNKVNEDVKSYKKNNGNLKTERSPYFTNLILIRESLKNYLIEKDDDGEERTCKSCGEKFTPEHGEYSRCQNCKDEQHSQAEKATHVESKKTIAEKAVSKSQQKFMGMVHAAQKGGKPASKEIAKVAKDMGKKDAKDFASTKHKGLPDKVGEDKDTKWRKEFKGKEDYKKGIVNPLMRKVKVKENKERKIMVNKVDYVKLQRAVELSESGKAVPARYLDTLKETLTKLTVRGAPKRIDEEQMRRFWAARGRKLTEGEVESAQAILAAKDMVDRLQDMLEDVGGMVNEDMPPLVDNVRDQVGADKASSFSTEVSAALTGLLDMLRQTRETVDASTRMLAGDDSGMGMPDDGMGGVDVGGEVPPVGTGAAADTFAGTDAAVGGASGLGREQR